MIIEFVGKHGGCLVQPGEYDFGTLSDRIWHYAKIYNVGHKVNWLTLENGIRAVGSANFLTDSQKLAIIGELMAAFTGRGDFQ